MASNQRKKKLARQKNRRRRRLKSVKSRLSERVQKIQEFPNATIQIDPPGEEKNVRCDLGL